jgi:hypothetical protein
VGGTLSGENFLILAKLHNLKIDWLSMVVVLFRWLVALSVALALDCCLSVTGWILAR